METNTAIVCITALVAIVGIVTIVLVMGGKVGLKLKNPRREISAHAESLSGNSLFTKEPRGNRRAVEK